MGKNTGWLAFGAILIIALLGFIAYGQFFSQSAVPGTVVTTSGQTAGGGVTNNIVTTNPTIAVAGTDALASGTAVGSSLTYQFNNGGGFVSTPTTAVPGQILEILATNDTTHHTQYVAPFTVNVASFPIAVKFVKNATVTENMYTTTGLVLGNANGAPQNQTALGLGGVYNLKDEMTPASLTETNPMTCILEIEAGNNATSTPAGATLSLNGAPLTLKSSSKPNWYSTFGANSAVYLYDTPSLVGGATATMNVGLTSQATKSFSGGTRFKKACYTKEWFIDPNTGLPTLDVANSDGTVQSMALYSYTIFFQ